MFSSRQIASLTLSLYVCGFVRVYVCLCEYIGVLVCVRVAELVSKLLKFEHTALDACSTSFLRCLENQVWNALINYLTNYATKSRQNVLEF